MYEMKNDDHCPVKIYKAYKGKRPTDYNQEDKPFNLDPLGTDHFTCATCVFLPPLLQ